MGVEPTRPAVQDTTVLKTVAATGPLPSPEFRTPFYTRPRQPRRENEDSQQDRLISVSLTCCLLLSIPGRARPLGEPSLPDYSLVLHPDRRKIPLTEITEPTQRNPISSVNLRALCEKPIGSFPLERNGGCAPGGRALPRNRETAQQVRETRMCPTGTRETG